MERRLGMNIDKVYFGSLLPALSRLPRIVGYRAVRALCPLAKRRNQASFQAALENLESCLRRGIRLPSTPARIANELFCQILWEDFDFFQRRRWNAQNWDSWFTIRGAEHLQQQQGAVLLTGHIGSVSIGLMALGVRGYSITHVSRDYHRESGIPSAFHQYALDKTAAIEEAIRGPLVFGDARDRARASQAVLEIWRRLRAGQLVSMALDLPADRLTETLECQFLGAPAHLGLSIVRIANALGRPVVPYWVLRDPKRPWKHILEIEPPIRVTDLPAAHQQCATVLERMILRHPGQWFAWDSLQRLRLTPSDAGMS